MATNNTHTNGTFPIKTAVVLKAVAGAYGISPAELSSAWGRAPRPIEEARRVAYALLHAESWLTWDQVATTMGRRARTGHIYQSARKANPEAVATVRALLRPDATQGELFR